MALQDKPKNKPIFDIKSKKYQNHYKIETDEECCRYLFNAGIAPGIIRSGTLSVEAINSQIKLLTLFLPISLTLFQNIVTNNVQNIVTNIATNIYRAYLHHSRQSLKLALQRSTIFFLSINIKKFHLNSDWIENEVSTELHQEFEKIISEVLNLYKVKKLYRNTLVPHISMNDEEQRKLFMKEIVKYKLRFKYDYEYFGASESMQLLNYLMQQNNDWKLNNDTLREIYKMFDCRFALSVIQHKCLKFGVEFDYNSVQSK